MPQLEVADFLPQIFWLFVIFILFYLIMAYGLLPKMSKTLDKRQQLIETQLQEAQMMRDKAEKLQKHYQQSLAQARQTAQEQLQQTALQLKQQLTEREHQVNQRLAKILQESEAGLARLKAQLQADARSLVPEVVQGIMHRLTGLSVGTQDVIGYLNQTDSKGF